MQQLKQNLPAAAGGKLNIVFLYDDRSTGIATVREHIEAFRNYSHHHYYYLPATNGSGWAQKNPAPVGAHVDLSIFDVVIVHYSVRLSLTWHFYEHISEQVAAHTGQKILFIQDEYETTETARKWMDKLQFDLVYTCVPEEGRNFVYPPERFPKTTFLPTLTGYVPQDSTIDHYIQPMAQRQIRIAYRGRILPPVYGKLAYEKYEIGVEMAKKTAERDIRADIEVDDAKRIYGTDWYQFLGSARATLGTESGANIFDFDGNLRTSTQQLMEQEPNLSFEQIHARLLAPHEGRVRMNQISPKIFEAIRLRTALILFEGNYSGVLQPETHYIPLKKNYANAEDVFAKLEDVAYLQALTDRAYRDIIVPGHYSYRSFVQKIDADIDRIAPVQARAELMSLPFGARYADGSFKPLIPTSAAAFQLSTGILGDDLPREQLTIYLQPLFKRHHHFLARSVRHSQQRIHLWMLSQSETLLYRIARRTFRALPASWRNRVAQRLMSST